MIRIVTGGIHSGKTTKLIDIWRAHPVGDGFVCVKNCADGLGYDLVRLSTGERTPFIRETGQLSTDWREAFRFDKFSFSASGMEFAEGIISVLIKSRVSPIFIDEVGPVELQGNGFDALFRKAIESGSDIYVAIREACVDDVLRQFGIREYRIISV
jgi:nucleoside-triphosphatase THEP1